MSSGAYSVFQTFQHQYRLNLNLSNTLLVVQSYCSTLYYTLQVNKTLTHLDLSNNRGFLTLRPAYCVFQGLQHNTSLVHFLSNTGLVVL